MRRKNQLEVQGKLCKTVVRPAVIYGAETWAVKKAQEKKLDVVEMMMFRWMCGDTKLDKVIRPFRRTTKRETCPRN